MNTCKIPIQSKFQALASAARSNKRCGESATVIALVPTTRQPVFDKVCLRHACELATWRAIETQRILGANAVEVDQSGGGLIDNGRGLRRNESRPQSL